MSVILNEGSRIFSFSPFKKYLIPSIYCGKGITHRIDKLSRLCQVCKMKKVFNWIMIFLSKSTVSKRFSKLIKTNVTGSFCKLKVVTRIWKIWKTIECYQEKHKHAIDITIVWDELYIYSRPRNIYIYGFVAFFHCPDCHFLGFFTTEEHFLCGNMIKHNRLHVSNPTIH